MKIGEVAHRSGVSDKTIRFWEEAGLLPAPARTPALYRNYEPAIVERLTFIRQAQSAGFSLAQIRRVLEIGDTGEPPCEHVGHLIAARLQDVDTRIAELKATRRRLQVLATRAGAQDPTECNGYCSILATD